MKVCIIAIEPIVKSEHLSSKQTIKIVNTMAARAITL
jgi:hypothetical protein